MPHPAGRQMKPQVEPMKLVYMDRAVHKRFLRAEHDDFTEAQCFDEFVAPPWSDQRFRPSLVYEFIRNFNAEKELTKVGDIEVKLDEKTLTPIFCLPKGPNKVEQRINTPRDVIWFSPDAVCKNGFQMKKCNNDIIRDRLVFQIRRYALQMQENRPQIARAQVLQAHDTRPRAWNSYFQRRLLEVLS